MQEAYDEEEETRDAAVADKWDTYKEQALTRQEAYAEQHQKLRVLIEAHKKRESKAEAAEARKHMHEKSTQKARRMSAGMPPLAHLHANEKEVKNKNILARDASSMDKTETGKTTETATTPAVARATTHDKTLSATQHKYVANIF
jgi:hypothetical protein